MPDPRDVRDQVDSRESDLGLSYPFNRAELLGNRRSREFRSRSIFYFFNSVGCVGAKRALSSIQRPISLAFLKTIVEAETLLRLLRKALN